MAADLRTDYSQQVLRVGVVGLRAKYLAVDLFGNLQSTGLMMLDRGRKFHGRCWHGASPSLGLFRCVMAIIVSVLCLARSVNTIGDGNPVSETC